MLCQKISSAACAIKRLHTDASPAVHPIYFAMNASVNTIYMNSKVIHSHRIDVLSHALWHYGGKMNINERKLSSMIHVTICDPLWEKGPFRTKVSL